MELRIFTIFFSFLASAQARQRIVGGSPAPEGKYPFQVFIKSNSEFRCGGSILNKRHVLTAGHCYQNPVSSFEVVVGSTKFMDDNATAYRVESIKIHEEYKRAPSGDHAINDIALFRLASDLVFDDKVQPVQLPEPGLEVKDDSTVTLTGWGTLSHNGEHPETLQEIELRVQNQTDCKNRWFFSKFISIEDSMMCTGADTGKGVCNGDSGSPLVSSGPQTGGAAAQVGIASFGWPCAGGKLPDVYTRVSSFVDWINDNL